MRKKSYVKPDLICEEFTPEAYCAACEHTEDGYGMYNFTCDAGGGVSGTVYIESNGIDGFQVTGCNCGEGHMAESYDGIFINYQCKNWVNIGDERLSSYHACGITHAASTNDAFLDGYYKVGDTVTPVVIWRGPNNDNTHCTTNINRDSWKKNIS